MRTKNYWISHSRVYHTITVKYKKVGQTFCISLPPTCLKRNYAERNVTEKLSE